MSNASKTEFLLVFPPDAAPCYMVNEEAAAWSQGAEHGAKEALEAVQLYLRNIGQPAMAMAVAQRVRAS